MKFKKLLIKKKIPLIFLIPLVIFFLIWLGNQNTIVVLTIDRAILGHEDAAAITSSLDSIQKNFFVKGIVLDIDSPGGTAEAIEEIYFRILSLKEKKAVVASINSIGASGAYYIASPSDYIFAKPSSEIGGVGVIAEVPEVIERKDVVVSGPFKGVKTKEQVWETVDLIKRKFIEVIVKNRKENLKIDPIELSAAKLYIGVQAKELGLIDELGSLNDAISKTADLSGLIFYKTTYIKPLKFDVQSLFVSAGEFKTNTTTAPKFYYLYINLGEMNE